MKLFILIGFIVSSIVFLFLAMLKRNPPNKSEIDEAMSGKINATKVSIRHWIDDLSELKGDGWFIVFKEPTSGNFFQMAWDKKTGFVFDLPTQSLNSTELSNAKEILDRYEIPLYWEGKQLDFSKNIGSDNALATEIAYVVHKRIIGLPDSTHLNVTIDR
jgi:hypothetical protein